MSHVYETFVDIKECGQQTGVAPKSIVSATKSPGTLEQP
jgi:hypothetical protein